MDSTVIAAAGAPFAPANALTSQREMFCRVYVGCGNAAEAARQAGYATDSARQQGHRLLADDTISHRIQELWAGAEVARATDRDLLVDKTEQLFDASMAAKNFNAAARALGLQARLAGFTGPARDREEVVPGRPGPVARAAARKAARHAEEEARESDGDRAASDGRARPSARPAPTEPSPAPSRDEGKSDGSSRPPNTPPEAKPDATGFSSPLGEEGREAAASRKRDGTGRGEPAQAPTPRPAVADPWAEAARIERERRLAGLHGTLSALRQRQARANEAALAALEAAEGGPTRRDSVRSDSVGHDSVGRASAAGDAARAA